MLSGKSLSFRFASTTIVVIDKGSLNQWNCGMCMILLYKFQVFADMEELGVKPDEDTVKRVARAFETLDQDDKKNLVIQRYGCKWKYVHFKGERVKVRRYPLVD